MRKEIDEVFTQVVLLLSSKGFISLNVEYIDGTKIESKANKYTFLNWRKTVERNRERLMKKIQVPLGQIDDVIVQENSSEGNEEIEFTPATVLRKTTASWQKTAWKPSSSTTISTWNGGRDSNRIRSGRKTSTTMRNMTFVSAP